MSDESKITSNLVADDPKILDANYRMDFHDRRYIDNQILGCETHLQNSLLNGLNGTWGMVDPSNPAVNAGDCLCNVGGILRTAVTANLAFSGALAGVALIYASPGGMVNYAVSGYVPNAITGLGAGTSGPVIINTTTGRLERTATYATTDFLAGTSDTLGGVTLRSASATNVTGGGGGGITPYFGGMAVQGTSQSFAWATFQEFTGGSGNWWNGGHDYTQQSTSNESGITTSASTGRITVLNSGTYRVTCSLQASTSRVDGNGQSGILFLYKNGAANNNPQVNCYASTGTLPDGSFPFAVVGEWIVTLTANDYVSLFYEAFPTISNTVLSHGQSYFIVNRIN